MEGFMDFQKYRHIIFIQHSMFCQKFDGKTFAEKETRSRSCVNTKKNVS